MDLNKGLKYIDELRLKGKKVLIRVDFNVPLDENGNITDDTRIRSVLPTINYALDEHAMVIIASHLGRPKGKEVSEMSLAPVAKRLGRLLDKDIKMAPDCIGAGVKKMVGAMEPGDVVMLENLRFHPEEEKNDEGFGKKLAELADGVGGVSRENDLHFALQAVAALPRVEETDLLRRPGSTLYYIPKIPYLSSTFTIKPLF